MRTIPAGLAAHLALSEQRLAICWRITKHTGGYILGTDHDADIVIPSGTYAGTYKGGANITASDARSTSDLSVDNMETEGAFPEDDAVLVDLTVADIEAGALDNAPVTVLLVNWSNPSGGYLVVRHGNLGALSRDSDGRYRTEVRGLTQRLSQQIGSTYGDRCNVVRFGDTRCGFDVEALRAGGSITSVTSRRRFVLTTGSPTVRYLYPIGGEVTISNGANAGYTKLIKRQYVVGNTVDIELWEPFPNDIVAGVTATVIPGCDRLWDTCRLVYDNVVNFRGYGLFVPGVLSMLSGPDSAGSALPGMKPGQLDPLAGGTRAADYIASVIAAGGSGVPVPTPTSPYVSTPYTGTYPVYPPNIGYTGDITLAPHLCSYELGLVDYLEPTRLALLQQQDLIVLNTWNGWEYSFGGLGAWQNVVAQIKSAGVTNKKVLCYYDYYEVHRNYQVNGADADVVAKLDAMTWWGYVRGTSGAIAASGFEDLQQVNLSRYVPRDSSGKNANEWLIDRANTIYHTGGVVNGTTNGGSSSLDGIIHDLMYWKARSDYDINRDGATDYRDSQFSIDETRRIFKDQVAYFRSIWPGSLHAGNMSPYDQTIENIPVYQDTVDIPLMEALIGESWSPETWGGFDTMRRMYQAVMAIGSARTLGFFTHYNVGDGVRDQSALTASDFRTLRYGFACCHVLGDAAYGPSMRGGPGRIARMDEYDNAGTQAKYLGVAIDGPQYEPWESGVWRRRYQGGIVLLNPKGNGARTVSLGGTYTKIAGRTYYSDTSVNNGASVTSVTLQDRDGLVLLV